MLLGIAGLLTTGTAAAATTPRIEVLSNRADLISGGDALVQVVTARPTAHRSPWPAATSPSRSPCAATAATGLVDGPRASARTS